MKTPTFSKSTFKFTKISKIDFFENLPFRVLKSHIFAFEATSRPAERVSYCLSLLSLPARDWKSIMTLEGGTFFSRIWSDLNKSLHYSYFHEFLKYGNDSWCKLKLRCCSKRCKSFLPPSTSFLPPFFALNIGNLHAQIRFSVSLLCKKRGVKN